MGGWVLGGVRVMGWTLGSPPLFPGSSRLPRSSLPDGPPPATNTGTPIVPGPVRLLRATQRAGHSGAVTRASYDHTFLTYSMAAEIRCRLNIETERDRV